MLNGKAVRHSDVTSLLRIEPRERVAPIVDPLSAGLAAFAFGSFLYFYVGESIGFVAAASALLFAVGLALWARSRRKSDARSIEIDESGIRVSRRARTDVLRWTGLRSARYGPTFDGC